MFSPRCSGRDKKRNKYVSFRENVIKTLTIRHAYVILILNRKSTNLCIIPRSAGEKNNMMCLLLVRNQYNARFPGRYAGTEN